MMREKSNGAGSECGDEAATTLQPGNQENLSADVRERERGESAQFDTDDKRAGVLGRSAQKLHGIRGGWKRRRDERDTAYAVRRSSGGSVMDRHLRLDNGGWIVGVGGRVLDAGWLAADGRR